MSAKKYEYKIEYLDEDNAGQEYETVAESDEEAFSRFETDTGYDESDINYCHRSAL